MSSALTVGPACGGPFLDVARYKAAKAPSALSRQQKYRQIRQDSRLTALESVAMRREGSRFWVSDRCLDSKTQGAAHLSCIPPFPVGRVEEGRDVRGSWACSRVRCVYVNLQHASNIGWHMWRSRWQQGQIAESEQEAQAGPGNSQSHRCPQASCPGLRVPSAATVRVSPNLMELQSPCLLKSTLTCS